MNSLMLVIIPLSTKMIHRQYSYETLKVSNKISRNNTSYLK